MKKAVAPSKSVAPLKGVAKAGAKVAAEVAKVPALLKAKGVKVPEPVKSEPVKPTKLIAFKPPKTMGGCADLLWELKAKRSVIQKSADAIEEQEKQLKAHIIETLPKSEASGVAGKVGRVTVVSKEVAQVTDWPAFYAHIKKTGDFDLLGRTIKQDAVKARWEAGKKVAGMGTFNAVTISLTKA